MRTSGQILEDGSCFSTDSSDKEQKFQSSNSKAEIIKTEVSPLKKANSMNLERSS